VNWELGWELAVELFEENDEGELVLEGEGREGPDSVGFLAEFGAVAIGGTDEEGDAFEAGVHFPSVDFFDKLLGGPVLAPFVEGDAEAAFGAGEEVFGDGFGVARFDIDQFDFGSAFEALEVFFNATFGVG